MPSNLVNLPAFCEMLRIHMRIFSDNSFIYVGLQCCEKTADRISSQKYRVHHLSIQPLKNPQFRKEYFITTRTDTDGHSSRNVELVEVPNCVFSTGT